MRAVCWGAAVFAMCLAGDVPAGTAGLLGVVTIGAYILLHDLDPPSSPPRPRGKE